MREEKKQLIVFLAEANSEFRKKFKDNFKEANIDARVLAFNCAEKLMSSIGQIPVFPDIIFLSFDQQNSSARTCLTRIRLKKNFSKVPIVIFSLSTYLEDINFAFENGASLFIPKNLYLKNSAKTIKSIFFSNWRKELLKPNKARFVLNASSVDENKLTWLSA